MDLFCKGSLVQTMFWILLDLLVLPSFIRSSVVPTEKARVRQYIDVFDLTTLNKIRAGSYSPSPLDFTARSYGDNRQERDYGGDFIYPEQTSRKRKTENCIHGLCTEVEGYPRDKIHRLLQKSNVSGYFDSTVEIPNRINVPEDGESQEDDRGETFCETIEHSLFPQKAKNSRGEEKTIVNVEGHQQGVVFKTCVNKGPCKLHSFFPASYTSYCKQEYVSKRLMVLGDEEKLVFDTFEVPSCCLCKLRKL